MEVNILSKEEARQVIDRKVFMLPNTFNVLSFKTYLEVKGKEHEMSDDELNTLTVEYIECIEKLNRNMSETIIQHFVSLKDYENQALLNHNKSNFDSEMNYIGKRGIEPFKEVINGFNKLILLSNETYLIASSYDIVALFD